MASFCRHYFQFPLNITFYENSSLPEYFNFHFKTKVCRGRKWKQHLGPHLLFVCWCIGDSMIKSQTILFIKTNHISIGFFPIMVFNIGKSQGSKESESLRWKSWLINETIVCPCSSVWKFNLVFLCICSWRLWKAAEIFTTNDIFPFGLAF